MLLPILAKKYAPYHTMPAFTEGYLAYLNGDHHNPFTDVAAQAFDRGMECAARVLQWTDQNVGAD